MDRKEDGSFSIFDSWCYSDNCNLPTSTRSLISIALVSLCASSDEGIPLEGKKTLIPLKNEARVTSRSHSFLCRRNPKIQVLDGCSTMTEDRYGFLLLCSHDLRTPGRKDDGPSGGPSGANGPRPFFFNFLLRVRIILTFELYVFIPRTSVYCKCQYLRPKLKADSQESNPKNWMPTITPHTLTLM
ncbi:unnamed protein product [Spirodela intermedia]|uniref:Uncharacterized protein n=1 Tax=Spirodela intermedia TaxID=51605 RepID=A0A7I8K009_SPIIN|nr:unnamed protein product [Spirodela intermedia]